MPVGGGTEPKVESKFDDVMITSSVKIEENFIKKEEPESKPTVNHTVNQVSKNEIKQEAFVPERNPENESLGQQNPTGSNTLEQHKTTFGQQNANGPQNPHVQHERNPTEIKRQNNESHDPTHEPAVKKPKHEDVSL